MAKIDLSKCMPSCSLEQLDPKVTAILSQIVHYTDRDVFVSSGFRSIEHEKKQGRDGSSSHTKGLACDILVKDNEERAKFLYLLFGLGAVRIGIGKNFIHFDLDKDKPFPRCWTYYE